MKKLIFLFYLLSFIFFTNQLQSTPYVGGEIYWECLSNGKYVFYIKAYRDCGSTAYSNQQTLNSPFGSISMSLVSGYPKEISPQCNSNSFYSHIACGGYLPQFTGATTEYLWKSAP